MTKSTTLIQVADRAGVSIATVSRVLRNNGYVAPQTRKRVEEAIRATGFRVNAVAQGLRSQRTFTIGHLMQSIAPNPFFAQVALGVESEARCGGYSVLLFNVNGEAQFEAEGLNRLIERRVDAVIFTTAVDAANVADAVAADIPVVQVERYTPVPTHMVRVNNYAGSAEAARHLVELGHTDIAYIGVDPTKGSTTTGYPGHREVDEQRMCGFTETMERHQLPVKRNLIRICRSYGAVGDIAAAPAEACEAARSLLAERPRPTAIFATYDIFAAGVLQAVYEAGLRVPADISVIGFDNTYAPYLAPQLTTVDQPMLDIGRTAARIVVQILQEEAPPLSLRTETLSTRLVVRASTGPSPR
jgi:DNA-binding LacI/PurR family transcriptional regulator